MVCFSLGCGCFVFAPFCALDDLIRHPQKTSTTFFKIFQTPGRTKGGQKYFCTPDKRADKRADKSPTLLLSAFVLPPLLLGLFSLQIYQAQQFTKNAGGGQKSLTTFVRLLVF
jgi:hypothetical protein